MTTPSTFTYLDGLLQGQASLAVSAGAGLTITADTWGNASPSTPLVVLCGQACTVTLPPGGAGKTAQTQIFIIKTGTTSYTVDIARNGGLINGAAADDQFAGTDTGIYRYNSDGTDWFRELSGGGAMQDSYDGGPDITGAVDMTWNLTGADFQTTADYLTTAGTGSAAFKAELVPRLSGAADVAAAANLKISATLDAANQLPTGTDTVAVYTVLVTATEAAGTPDAYQGTMTVMYDGATGVTVSPLLDLRDFNSADYTVTGTCPAASSNLLTFQFDNNSASEVGVVLAIIAYEYKFIEATP